MFKVFLNASNLKNVCVSISWNCIANHCFQSCSQILRFTIPESVETIGHHWFNICSNLRTFSIPESVRTIESCCFQNCSNLPTVSISRNNQPIGEYWINGYLNFYVFFQFHDQFKHFDHTAIIFAQHYLKFSILESVKLLKEIVFRVIKLFWSITFSNSFQNHSFKLFLWMIKFPTFFISEFCSDYRKSMLL
jgi:hypothetical protein